MRSSKTWSFDVKNMLIDQLLLIRFIPDVVRLFRAKSRQCKKKKNRLFKLITDIMKCIDLKKTNKQNQRHTLVTVDLLNKVIIN